METKRFHLGALLNIVPGRLVSSGGVDDVYKLLNWMTGDNLFTHQLPRASRECKPWLLLRHPELKKIGKTEVAELDRLLEEFEPHCACTRWVSMCADILCCSQFDVAPIPKDDHEHIDPVTEAENMIGKDKVIVVKTYGDSPCDPTPPFEPNHPKGCGCEDCGGAG